MKREGDCPLTRKHKSQPTMLTRTVLSVNRKSCAQVVVARAVDRRANLSSSAIHLRPSSSLYPPGGEGQGPARRQWRGVRVGYLFSALSLLGSALLSLELQACGALWLTDVGAHAGLLSLTGIGATSYGLYQWYTSFTAYPAPLRTHLRTALRSSLAGDFEKSSESFERAYTLAKELASVGQLGAPDVAILRISGINVRWGKMWEDAGRPARARQAYSLALEDVRSFLELDSSSSSSSPSSSSASPTLGSSSDDVLSRAVGLAVRIGDLHVDEGNDDKAEPLYVWGLEELMRRGMTESQKQKVADIMHDREDFPSPSQGKDERIGSGSEGELPEWATSVQVVGTMERLGDLYARTGHPEYAQPLLQQAIVSLLPPPLPPSSSSHGGPRPTLPPVPTRCHAATLMNNLSSSFIPTSSSTPPTPEQIDSASRWARQALSVAYGCRKELDKSKGVFSKDEDRTDGECDRVAVVGAYNLGKLSELAGDKASARSWYQKSQRQATRIGYKEGVLETIEALRNLET